MNTNKKTRLLFIVRNNFTLRRARALYEHKQTSILGVYTSLKKAYLAGHLKAKEMKTICPEHRMELKVVKPNSYNYVGCSAYSIDFSRQYSDKELRDLSRKIHKWFDKDMRLYNEECEQPYIKAQKGQG